MAYRKIIEFPDKRLRNKSQSVVDFDEALQVLAADLHDTINVTNGVGLSAPQIGVFWRVIYIGAGKFNGIMVNPQIIESNEPEPLNEGCLSFPGVFEQINRSTHIKCSYQDVTGNEHVMDAYGLSAHIIQHETEHLDGKLLVDHLSRLKRARIQRKIKKQERLLKAQTVQDETSSRKKKNSRVSKKELKIRKKRRLQARR